jgi:hypothetical protein
VTITLSASLDAVPGPGQDMVFCATLGLAWNAFRRRFGEQALSNGAPSAAVALDALAKGPPPLAEVVPAEAAFVAAGGPEQLDTARASLHERFPGAPADLLPETLPPGGRFAFALLDRALAFDPVLDPKDVVYGSEMVRGFCASGRDPARAASVVVHDHVPGESFVVELLARGGPSAPSEQDRILVLATVPPLPWAPPAPPVPRLSLAERVREALSRLDRAPAAARALSEEESFSMPTLRIQEKASFPELTRAPIPLADGTSLALDEAVQSVLFSIDETGARAQSQAALVAYGAPPRSFAVSGPFLIMLVRRGASIPYLAAWIEGTDAMQKAPGSPGAPGGMWKVDPPSGSGGFGPFGPPPA